MPITTLQLTALAYGYRTGEFTPADIDVAGMPTTAACPGYAYRPSRSAPIMDRLLAAGAVLIGTNNLDQFATGLSGSRSPYGSCESSWPAYLATANRT
ncbi:amidase family protein [Planotetraspora sp. GP83]|uniref:amidase family protein n=1 Tax=Planotetraspora sp. GP83 TaxID=3156264 RepID=UPI0035128574